MARQGMLAVPVAVPVGLLFPLVLTSLLEACPQLFLWSFFAVGCP